MDDAHPVFCIDDTICLILSQLALRDLFSASLVCSRWNEVIQDDKFWQTMCAREGIAAEEGDAKTSFRNSFGSWSCETEKRTETKFVGHTNGVRGLDMKIGSSFFITASDDKCVKVWYGRRFFFVWTRDPPDS
jgi:hypothetical protein